MQFIYLTHILVDIETTTNLRTFKNYYLATDVKMSWFDAFTFCRQFNKDLLNIRTREEQTHIMEFIQNDQFYNSEQLHIGATNLGSPDKSWYWLKTNKTVDFQMKWYPGEPNNPSHERCLSISKGLNYLGYNDASCSEDLKMFVCEESIKEEFGLKINYEL